MLEFVFFKSPQDHFIVGLEALLHDLSLCLYPGDSLIYLLEDGQSLILIVDDGFQIVDLLGIIVVSFYQLAEHILVLVHLVDERLSQIRHQGSRLGGQVEPQDVEGLEVLREASSESLSTFLLGTRTGFLL